jgi:aspartyl-tRNA(Asn)/glutamyl-tRNA(Gln) amidotransferase subunit C
MKITAEEVLNVAHLARLEIDPEFVEKMADQLASILTYVEKLGEVDTENVPPTSHAIALTNAFREDTVRPSLPREKALDNAPAQEDGGFVVPKVI